MPVTFGRSFRIAAAHAASVFTSARALTLTGVFMLTGLLMLASDPASAQRGPTSVVVDEVRVEPMAQTMSVVGRVVPRQSGVLAGRLAERVEQVPVQVGDRVRKGDVLARLSDDRMSSEHAFRTAERDAAVAQVAGQRAALDKARQNLDRQNSLKGSTAFRKDRADDARRDFEGARADLAVAEANLARASAQLDLAAIALADTVIRAPFPGVVTVRHAVAGSYIRVGDPVITLLNDQELEIEADVPSNRTGGLELGSLVEADLQPGGRIFAVVRAVVPEENPRTRTRSARFVPQLPDAGTELISNQSVTVFVPVGERRDVLTVHKDAVVVQGPRSVAFVVQDGKVSSRVVTLGESLGTRFEVLDGLAPGDQAVIRGNERLRDGMDVVVGGGQTGAAPIQSAPAQSAPAQASPAQAAAQDNG
jgi:RND family efflux transporter MFP subunit